MAVAVRSLLFSRAKNWVCREAIRTIAGLCLELTVFRPPRDVPERAPKRPSANVPEFMVHALVREYLGPHQILGGRNSHYGNSNPDPSRCRS